MATMAQGSESAAQVLARVHDMYDNERYIEAGDLLQTAIDDGAVAAADGEEARWQDRCARDAAAAVQLRDALVALRVGSHAPSEWSLETDAEGIAVLYREEAGNEYVQKTRDSHARTHARTHAHARTHTHTRTHARTHTHANASYPA